MEYYFSKGFGILERNSTHFKKIPNLAKQRIHAEETHDSDYFMTCNTTISYIPNILKKFWLQSSLNSSYTQTKYNGREESIKNIFGTYVETLLNDINHPALVQKWKLNIYAAAYEEQFSEVNRP